jgi:hypothetical protein
MTSSVYADHVDSDRFPHDGSNDFHHSDGQICVGTLGGRWLRSGEGLGPQAECHREHEES